MKDFTSGSITRAILALSIPTAVGMVFQILYSLVDLYFVAALGPAAIAGVSAASTLMFMVLSLTQILGVSSIAMISQAVGRQDREHATHVFNQSMVLSTLLAGLTLLLGYFFAEEFVGFIVADRDAIADAVTFLQWFLPAMALQFPLTTISAALRATGVVKPAMAIQTFTVLMNVVLAPVLIAGSGPGPALGVAGAGLASSLSGAAGAVLFAIYFVKYEGYVSFRRSSWSVDLNVWKRSLDIGLPAGGEMMLMFSFMTVVLWVIKDFGAEAQAGFGIGWRIMQAVFLPTIAIAFAIGPIAGQNFGAGQAGRVRAVAVNGLILCSTLMLALTLLIQYGSEALVRVFADEERVVASGARFLQVMSLNLVAQGVIFTCSAMFQGLGNTWPALLSSAMRLGLFVLVVGYFRAQETFTLDALWYAAVATVAVQALVSYNLLRGELIRRLSQVRLASSV